MISNKLMYLKKHQKQKRAGGARAAAAKGDEPVHARDGEAFEQNMIIIDEFKFPHIVF